MDNKTLEGHSRDLIMRYVEFFKQYMHKYDRETLISMANETFLGITEQSNP